MINRKDSNGAANARAVSIVIPTRNRAASLLETLIAVENLRIPTGINLQLVVVMDGCTDHTAQTLSQWRSRSGCDVLCVETAGLGAGGARNEGIARASGEFIGFIDDDVLPDELWLQHHVDCQLANKKGVVSLGAMKLPSHKRLPPWNEWEVLSLQGRYDSLMSGAAVPDPSDLYTANAMIPTEALQAVGGFDDSLQRAEDVELAARLFTYGLEFVFLPQASVVHCPIRTLRGWKNIPVAYAKSHVTMQNDGANHSANFGAPSLAHMHSLTRIAVKCFSGSEFRTSLYCSLAQSVGLLAHWMRLRSISYAAFSSVYNVLYFGTLTRTLASVPRPLLQPDNSE